MFSVPISNLRICRNAQFSNFYFHQSDYSFDCACGIYNYRGTMTFYLFFDINPMAEDKLSPRDKQRFKYFAKTSLTYRTRIDLNFPPWGERDPVGRSLHTVFYTKTNTEWNKPRERGRERDEATINCCTLCEMKKYISRNYWYKRQRLT